MGSRGKSKLRDVKTKEINQRERVIRFFFKVACSFMCLEERNGKTGEDEPDFTGVITCA